MPHLPGFRTARPAVALRTPEVARIQALLVRLHRSPERLGPQPLLGTLEGPVPLPHSEAVVVARVLLDQMALAPLALRAQGQALPLKLVAAVAGPMEVPQVPARREVLVLAAEVMEVQVVRLREPAEVMVTLVRLILQPQAAPEAPVVAAGVGVKISERLLEKAVTGAHGAPAAVVEAMMGLPPARRERLAPRQSLLRT